MRISTAYPQQFNINSMFDQQSKLNETQLKISSGKKYLSPSENPSAAAYSLGFKQSISETQQYQNNIDAVTQRLQLEETTLTSAIDTIQRLQELGLQGVSDSGNSTISRNAIATEFDQLNEHLMGLANTRNANGEYIFSGTKTTEMPFGKKANVDSKLNVVTLAAAELKATASENLPAQTWKKFITQQAISAAYDFALNNPGSTADDAAAWAASQDTSATVAQGQVDASKDHKTFPTVWQAAWNDTPITFNSEFNKAFAALDLKKLPVASLKQSADLATTELNQAKNAYKTALANYTDPTTATQTITTEKSTTWTDYISKQAVQDAYELVDKFSPTLTIDDALKKTAVNLESYNNIVNSSAGVDAGNKGSLAFRISADQTNKVYTDAFKAVFDQAFADKAATDSVLPDSPFNTALTDAKVTATTAWNAYSTASDRTLTDSSANTAITTADLATTTTVATTPSTANSTGIAANSAFIYSGSNTQREIQIGGSRTITDSDTGIAVFGPSNVTGKTLFDTVKNFSDELRADKPTLATLKELDDAMTRLSTVRSTIGARQNALDRQKASNQDFIINTQTALSQIEDLDYAGAITQLNSQQMSLQAAQQSYAKVQGMSLFKFL
ncbi:MAG: flagellar hook-associated protein FlgL [Methylococcales bacterium]|nr:flagellar hook-associated protein FlgL [Methylococcales bacterium]